jgi:hypothetical protein
MLRIALHYPDLKLFFADETPSLSEAQREHMFIIFSMLVSLFERAHLLLYEDDMSAGPSRRWLSWEDYMREWWRRADFRRVLPTLLKGEDVDFATYTQTLARLEDEARKCVSPAAV